MVESAFWIEQINAYETIFEKWLDRSKKIVERYRDERDARSKGRSRFNILWSNIQTLSPALYDRAPKPNIERRRKDYENTSRAVSQVLEKCVSYFVDAPLFDDVMRQSVFDRLTAGRGSMWIRYVPDMDEEATTLYAEDVVADFVHYRDFGHTAEPVWQKVRAVWRKVYLSKKDLKKEFPDLTAEQLAAIPLDAKPVDDPKVQANKACIYEIWDKQTRKVYFVHKALDFILKEEEDPLRLKDFFPCPKPVYSSFTTETLVPIPDFLQYQDQAIELDELTGRIQSLTKALKVVGVYDASAEGVQRLLEDGVENKLIPVSNWAVFGEKGGLKGVVDYFPMQDVMVVLGSLYQAREAVKQVIYEITGISDIVRGNTKASESATAQKIKGQFATLRLDDMQGAVARYARDAVSIMTEIIAEHFSLDTIKAISGVPLLTNAEKQQVQMALQMQQPVPESVLKQMREPSWEEVDAIIRDDLMRCFSIDVETDSTIKIDQEMDKKERTEFLAATSNFLQQAVQVEDKSLRPLMVEMLMFGVKGFKIGRDLESAFYYALDNAKQEAEAPPPPPPPDPALEVQKLQAAQQAEQMQADMQIKSAELQLKEKEIMLKAQLEYAKLQKEPASNGEKSEPVEQPDMSDTVEVLQAKIQARMQKDQMDAQEKAQEMSDEEQERQLKIAEMQQRDAQAAAVIQSLNTISIQLNDLGNALTRPKTVVRENGVVVGVI